MKHFVGYLLLVVCAMPALALEIRMMPRKYAESPYMVLSGEIVRGDYEQIITSINDDVVNNDGRFLFQSRRIVLGDIRGGSVNEAILLASLFRDTHVRTISVGDCLSACFILIAGSVERAVGGRVGLHNPYLEKSNTAGMTPRQIADAVASATSELGARLERMGVPRYLVERMSGHSSQELYWLNQADRVALGAFYPGVAEMRLSMCKVDVQYERELLESPPTSEHDVQVASAYRRRIQECENKALRKTVAEGLLKHIESDELTRRIRPSR